MPGYVMFSILKINIEIRWLMFAELIPLGVDKNANFVPTLG